MCAHGLVDGKVIGKKIDCMNDCLADGRVVGKKIDCMKDGLSDSRLLKQH